MNPVECFHDGPDFHISPCVSDTTGIISFNRKAQLARVVCLWCDASLHTLTPVLHRQHSCQWQMHTFKLLNNCCTLIFSCLVQTHTLIIPILVLMFGIG